MRNWLLVEATYNQHASPLVKVMVIFVNYAQAAMIVFILSLIAAVAWRLVN